MFVKLVSHGNPDGADVYVSLDINTTFVTENIIMKTFTRLSNRQIDGLSNALARLFTLVFACVGADRPQSMASTCLSAYRRCLLPMQHGHISWQDGAIRLF